LVFAASPHIIYAKEDGCSGYEKVRGSKLNESKHFLDPFFYPKTIAIVGATANSIKMNFQITENLQRLKFQGKIYPVNPNANEILGMKTYPSIGNIPDGIDIDLVVCAVPAISVMGVVKDCVEKGIKRMVIVAGGFCDGDVICLPIRIIRVQTQLDFLSPWHKQDYRPGQQDGHKRS
jgi:predicted CoA-binding protein